MLQLLHSWTNAHPPKTPNIVVFNLLIPAPVQAPLRPKSGPEGAVLDGKEKKKENTPLIDRRGHCRCLGRCDRQPSKIWKAPAPARLEPVPDPPKGTACNGSSGRLDIAVDDPVLQEGKEPDGPETWWQRQCAKPSINWQPSTWGPQATKRWPFRAKLQKNRAWLVSPMSFSRETKRGLEPGLSGSNKLPCVSTVGEVPSGHVLKRNCPLGGKVGPGV